MDDFIMPQREEIEVIDPGDKDGTIITDRRICNYEIGPAILDNRRIFMNSPIAISPRKYADICKAVSGLRGKTPDLEQEMKYILEKCRYDAWNGYYQSRITITSKNEPLFGQIAEELRKEGFTVRAKVFEGFIYIRWDDENWDYLDRNF